MTHPHNKTIAATFLLSSVLAAAATTSVREASAKNFRNGAAACMPRMSTYFTDTDSEIYDGGDFSADNDDDTEMICAIPEFSDWNRSNWTELTVVMYDNSSLHGTFTAACRSNFSTTTDSCGEYEGSSNPSQPGWASYFPPVTGADGVWDDTTLGTTYIFVGIGQDTIFDGYIIKDSGG